MSLVVSIGKMEDEPVVTKAGATVSTELGMSVQDLTKEKAREFGHRVDSGALVNELQANGVAAMAGIQVGDVVVAVGDVAVSGASQFNEAMSKQDLARGIRMQISRGGTTRYVFLRIQK